MPVPMHQRNTVDLLHEITHELGHNKFLSLFFTHPNHMRRTRERLYRAQRRRGWHLTFRQVDDEELIVFRSTDE